MPGALDPVRRRLVARTGATKRSADFVALLDDLGTVHGTTGRTRPPIAVADDGPIHASKLTRQTLTDRPWVTVERLPKCAPELNNIERPWRDLEQHRLADRTFLGADDLDHHIRRAVDRLDYERRPHPSALLGKAA